MRIKLAIIYNKIISLCSRWYSIMILLVLYKIFLDLLYLKHLTTDFGYTKLLDPISVISGYLFVFIIGGAFIYLYKEETASSIFIIILSLIYFIPLAVYCSYGSGSNGLFLGACIFFIIFLILHMKMPYYALDLSFLQNKKRSNIFTLLIVCCVTIAIYIIFRYGNFSIAINIFDVYGIRENAEEYDMGTLFSYIFSILKIIFPVLIVYCIATKHYICCCCVGLTELLLYSVDAVKSVLFMTIFSIIGYYLYKKNMQVLILPMSILLEIGALLETIWNNSMYLIDLFIRRVMFVPVVLADNYFKFFSENPLDIARSGILGKMGFSTPYQQNIALVIGNNYDNQFVSANTGLLGDAYATLGFLGFILFPFILIICIRVLDLASDKLNIKIIIGSILYFAVAFTNAVWSTILLSHGFLVICFLYLLFPRNNEGLIERKD